MMGPQHVATSAASGALVGVALGWPWPQTVAAAWLATLTAAGPLSPDGDQSWLPGEHRHFWHWWGLPAAAYLACLLLPSGVRWVGVALVTGWAGHLLGDFVHGRPGAGRGPGIPLRPFPSRPRHWKGLGLPVDHWTERLTAFLLSLAALGAVLASLS